MHWTPRPQLLLVSCLLWPPSSVPHTNAHGSADPSDPVLRSPHAHAHPHPHAHALTHSRLQKKARRRGPRPPAEHSAWRTACSGCRRVSGRVASHPPAPPSSVSAVPASLGDAPGCSALAAATASNSETSPGSTPPPGEHLRRARRQGQGTRGYWSWRRRIACGTMQWPRAPAPAPATADASSAWGGHCASHPITCCVHSRTHAHIHAPTRAHTHACTHLPRTTLAAYSTHSSRA